jgi:hypothetical protein
MATHPKGSFKDLYGGVLDVALECLGESVCYRPKAGGTHTINAVFDEKAIQTNPDTEEFVSSNDPRIGVKLCDLPFIPRENDRVDIGKLSFKVKEVQEDGQGGADIFLFRIC